MYFYLYIDNASEKKKSSHVNKTNKTHKHIQETVSYAMPGPKFNSLSNLNYLHVERLFKNLSFLNDIMEKTYLSMRPLMCLGISIGRLTIFDSTLR